MNVHDIDDQHRISTNFPGDVSMHNAGNRETMRFNDVVLCRMNNVVGIRSCILCENIHKKTFIFETDDSCRLFLVHGSNKIVLCLVDVYFLPFLTVAGTLATTVHLCWILCFPLSRSAASTPASVLGGLDSAPIAIEGPNRADSEGTFTDIPNLPVICRETIKPILRYRIFLRLNSPEVEHSVLQQLLHLLMTVQRARGFGGWGFLWTGRNIEPQTLWSGTRDALSPSIEDYGPQIDTIWHRIGCAFSFG